MTDRTIVRRLRVTAFGILGALICIELIRAATIWFAVSHHATTLALLVPLAFSTIVLAVVAVLIFAVFIPAERTLEEQIARYRSIFDRNPNPAVAIDRDGAYLRVNAAMERLSGYHEDELLGHSFRMTAPQYVETVRRALDAGLHGASSQHDIAFIRKNGEMRDIHIDAIPMDAGGAIEGIYAFSRDITDERRALRREAQQRERFRAVAMLAAHEMESERAIAETLDFAAASLGMDAAHVGVVTGNIIAIVAGNGFGYPSGVEVPLERSFARHVLNTTDVLVIEDVRVAPWENDAARAWQPWNAYVSVAVPIGGERSAALTLVKKEPLLGFDDADRDFVTVIASLIGANLARERQERELAELAFVDGLTHLPNRAYFTEHLDGAIAQSHRESASFAVHYVDLDGFKAVNDRHGHEAGDHVLAVIAARLKMAARLSDVVARHGGDEFIVLQRRYDGPIGASLLAQRLIDAAAEPIVIRDEIVRLGASVGIAVFPNDARTAEELLRCADSAMYRAKHAGRNRHELFA